MKLFNVIFILFFTTQIFGQADFDIFAGYEDGRFNNSTVITSKWLERAAENIGEKYDFYENVSYTGEDWDEVEVFCGWTSSESSYYYDRAELIPFVDWNKIVNNQGKTQGYILYLLADVGGDCYFPRGIYIIDNKSKEVSSDYLEEEFSIDFGSFLTNKYIRNDPQMFF